MIEPTLRSVAIAICSACLDGEGGECHTPGCALWLHRTDTLRVHPELYAELPSEKPLPDAPGWWIVQEDGEASELRLVEMRLDEEGGIIDAEGLSPSQWDSSDRLAFGPIALPWGAT